MLPFTDVETQVQKVKTTSSKVYSQYSASAYFLVPQKWTKTWGQAIVLEMIPRSMNEVLGKGSLEEALALLRTPSNPPPHTPDTSVLLTCPPPHCLSPGLSLTYLLTCFPVATVHTRDCGLIVVPDAHRSGLQDPSPSLKATLGNLGTSLSSR